MPSYGQLLALLLGSYLLGSIPFGYLVCRAIKGVDIRTVGSGNIGATNVFRVLGKAWGVTVMALDIAKGFGPVWLAQAWFHLPLWTLLAAAAAVLGHSKSIWLRFGGGKAVATGAGTILGLDPLVGLIALAIWAGLVATTRYVSLASIAAAVAVPVLLAVHARPWGFVAYGAIVAVFIVIRHRGNIQRLIQGTEPKFGAKATT